MRQTPSLPPAVKSSVGRSTGLGSGILADAIPVYDSQCGFKLIRRKCYEAIRSELREKRFAFDVELLVALRHIGAKVIEVPIDWFDVPGSKVHFVRDTARMVAAIIGIRMRDSDHE